MTAASPYALIGKPRTKPYDHVNNMIKHSISIERGTRPAALPAYTILTICGSFTIDDPTKMR